EVAQEGAEPAVAVGHEAAVALAGHEQDVLDERDAPDRQALDVGRDVLAAEAGVGAEVALLGLRVEGPGDAELLDLLEQLRGALEAVAADVDDPQADVLLRHEEQAALRVEGHALGLRALAGLQARGPALAVREPEGVRQGEAVDPAVADPALPRVDELVERD